MDYEVIIGTQESDDSHLAVAQATAILKEEVPDASVWRVDLYDEGGVGLNITTAEVVGESDRFETVEELATSE